MNSGITTLTMNSDITTLKVHVQSKNDQLDVPFIVVLSPTANKAPAALDTLAWHDRLIFLHGARFPAVIYTRGCH
jgi:hypothetical protein